MWSLAGHRHPSRRGRTRPAGRAAQPAGRQHAL